MKKLFISFACLFILIFGMVSIAPAIPINGLVAEYLFDGNANDESGNGNHGTIYGTTLTEDRFGNPDSAYSFDGINDFIEVANHHSLALTSALTISVWINQYVYTGRLVDKLCAGVNNGYMFDTNGGPSGPAMRLCGAGTINTYANTSYSLNEWHHLAVVFENGVSTFYLDGKYDGTGNHSEPTMDVNNYTLRIGTSHGDESINGFEGIIDDVCIYNRALTGNEIQELYAPVPEPSTCLLFIFGMLGMVGIRKGFLKD